MRLHESNPNAILNHQLISEYMIGDAVVIDIAYVSSTSRRPHTPKLVNGTVINKFSPKNNFGIMVGSGTKIHKGEGLQIEVEGIGNFWFGVQNICQQYRGKGNNWHRVSGMRVIEQPEHITCSKCSMYFNNPFIRANQELAK